MRTYDTARALTTLLGAGVAGFLVWLATQVGQTSTARFWESMGLVAAAGLVMALSQLLGGWTKFGWPRLSGPVFLFGFLPALVCVGWILMATQRRGGWHGGTVAGWSRDIGIFGVVHDLGLYHGVLAFGLGLVLGYALDTTGLHRRDEVVVDRTPAPVAAPVPVEDRTAADEPLTAERTAVLPPSETRDGDLALTPAGRNVEIREGGAPVTPRPDPEQTPASID